MTDVIVGAILAIFAFLLFTMFLVIQASASTGKDKCLEDEAQKEFCKTYNQKKEKERKRKTVE